MSHQNQHEAGQVPLFMKALLDAQQAYSRAQASIAINESILHRLCSTLSSWSSWNAVEQQIRRIDDLKQDAYVKQQEVSRLLGLRDFKAQRRFPSAWGRI